MSKIITKSVESHEGTPRTYRHGENIFYNYAVVTTRCRGVLYSGGYDFQLLTTHRFTHRINARTTLEPGDLIIRISETGRIDSVAKGHAIKHYGDYGLVEVLCNQNPGRCAWDARLGRHGVKFGIFRKDCSGKRLSEFVGW